VTYQYGHKVGGEIYWSRDGRKLWEWAHRPDGSSVWTRWWRNGRKRSESTWREFRCVGVARTWDPSGKLTSEIELTEGVLAEIRTSP
jgi:antitoxin component YwqK of YwqJK toxin-antitoxin module